MKNSDPRLERGFRGIGGFALVATILMMVLLAIIAIGTLSLSTISVRATNQDAALSTARANARMALMIAVGELQKYAGPDTRITARAATLSKHEKLAIEDSANPAASPTAKAWWVGVASSDKEKTIGPSNQHVVWLISGLERSKTPESQIASSFDRAIPMHTRKSIDLGLTGGESITAGAVPIIDNKDRKTGSYAYYVDDNGMKAQLNASHSDLVNEDESTNRPGRTVIPGSYDLSILDGMNAFENTSVADFSKLLSINDLPLLGDDIGTEISKNKRLSYTTQSLGGQKRWP